jgi:hypothetical protein
MGEGKARGDEVMDYRALSAYLKVAEGTLRHYVMRGKSLLPKSAPCAVFENGDRPVASGTEPPPGREGGAG